MERRNNRGQRISAKQTLLDKSTQAKQWGQNAIQLSVLKELKHGIAELPKQSLNQPPSQEAKMSHVIGSCMSDRINKATFSLDWW